MLNPVSSQDRDKNIYVAKKRREMCKILKTFKECYLGVFLGFFGSKREEMLEELMAQVSNTYRLLNLIPTRF